jgi:allantoinase
MNDYDLLVRAGQDIGISEGRIVARGENLAGSAAREIDAHGLSIFPGVIDSHVHFNEPGRTHWEGFATGSRAAAAGGTTTIFDMPLNSHPPTIDGPSFDGKRAAAEAQSLVDFGLWGGLVPGNVDELEALRDRGVVGLKAFMCNSGIDDFEFADDATLREGMKRAAELDLLVAVHAESQEMTAALAAREHTSGNGSVRAFLDSRPIATELEAIRRAIDLAGETSCRLHIVHVSCAAGVDLVSEAARVGVDVTCETCPHYLLLSDRDMERLGAVAKCAPPLRSPAEQQALRERLADVHTIGSDHSPAPWELKEQADFFAVWGGISSCQHLLPLLIDTKIDAGTISRVTSANVAARFRLAGKGKLEVGCDADFTLLDFAREEEITAESLHYRHRHSPYIGRSLRARVVGTFLRGQEIFGNGSFGAQPAGRLVRPQTS